MKAVKKILNLNIVRVSWLNAFRTKWTKMVC